MKPGQLELLRAVEDVHWWHRTLQVQVLEALRHHVRPGATVLDAGCGTGGLLARLSEYSTCGCDASARAVELCSARGLARVTQARVESLPYADETMDAVLSLDVLYHAEVDDTVALREMSRVLRPGGILIVNTAAFECLRGAHDEAVCGARRYRKAALAAQVTAAGFEVQIASYWNAWLFPALWLRRRFFKAVHGDLKLPPRWLNSLLERVARLDAWICRCLRVPWGSSILLVAVKTTDAPMQVPPGRHESSGAGWRGC